MVGTFVRGRNRYLPNMTMISSGTARSSDTASNGCFCETDLVLLVKLGRGFVSVYRPIFDGFEGVRDGHLVWWNDAYENVRVRPPSCGESFVGVATDLDAACAAMTEAWHVGHCVQHFEFSYERATRFNIPTVGKQTWMEWQRIGDHLVRTVLDLDEMDAIHNFYTNEESNIAEIARIRAVAAERERIARNMHDTVIQNLYATALELSGAGVHVHGDAENAINIAIESIGKIIDRIRSEILDYETPPISPLMQQIASVVEPILAPTNADCTFDIDVDDLPGVVGAEVRSVCTEAVSNAVRHGHATCIGISLAWDREELRLLIEDNGSGIPAEVTENHGLKNMRKRAETLGGTMEATKRDEGGTRVAWTVPYVGGAR